MHDCCHEPLTGTQESKQAPIASHHALEIRCIIVAPIGGCLNAPALLRMLLLLRGECKENRKRTLRLQGMLHWNTAAIL
jgi:hypothetical protein